MIKKSILLFLILLIPVVSMPTTGIAQYYGHYYYLPPPAYLDRSRPMPADPYYYYMRPRPYNLQRWDRENRWNDYLNETRSPLNPESTLEYLMRTF